MHKPTNIKESRPNVAKLARSKLFHDGLHAALCVERYNEQDHGRAVPLFMLLFLRWCDLDLNLNRMLWGAACPMHLRLSRRELETVEHPVRAEKSGASFSS